jgi:hypothetical protein
MAPNLSQRSNELGVRTPPDTRRRRKSPGNSQPTDTLNYYGP